MSEKRRSLSEGKELPDTDHVARYASFMRIAPSRQAVEPHAFRLRAEDGGCCSVNWMERTEAETEEGQVARIIEIRNARGLTTSQRAGFAKLAIGEVRAKLVESNKRLLRFLYDPVKPSGDDPGDETHACLRGYEIAEAFIEAELARAVERLLLVEELDEPAK